MKKSKRTGWGFVDGEPYLGDGLASTPEESYDTEKPWFAKTLQLDARGFLAIFRENPPYRRFKDLPDGALLDTEDVARLAGCSGVTVTKHVLKGRLRPHPKASSRKNFFYTKSDVVAWLRVQRAGKNFKAGRPPQNPRNQKSLKAR